MFFSVTTRNLKWENLTTNSVIFKRWDGVKDEKISILCGVHCKMFRVGFPKNQYIVGNCLKRGTWTVSRFKGRLGKKEEVVFLKGGGGNGDTLMHTMAYPKVAKGYCNKCLLNIYHFVAGLSHKFYIFVFLWTLQNIVKFWEIFKQCEFQSHVVWSWNFPDWWASTAKSYLTKSFNLELNLVLSAICSQRNKKNYCKLKGVAIT